MLELHKLFFRTFSVLGPLLFLLYVNDVTDIFDGNCVSKLYADDIKLYYVQSSESDCSDLQRQLIIE